jgi:hypothetical protein
MDRKPVRSAEELVEFLVAQRREVEYDATQPALTLSTAEPELGEGRILIRWGMDAPLVQLIQPMLEGVPRRHAASIARAICRINCSHRIAGLRYNEEAGGIFLRFSLLRYQDTILANQVYSVANLVTLVAKDLLPAMKAVASGASVEDAVKLAPAAEDQATNSMPDSAK